MDTDYSFWRRFEKKIKDSLLEKRVAYLTRLAHPYDQGKATRVLEEALREELLTNQQ